MKNVNQKEKQENQFQRAHALEEIGGHLATGGAAVLIASPVLYKLFDIMYNDNNPEYWALIGAISAGTLFLGYGLHKLSEKLLDRASKQYNKSLD